MRWRQWRHDNPIVTFVLAWVAMFATVIAVGVCWWYSTNLPEAVAATALIVWALIWAFTD